MLKDKLKEIIAIVEESNVHEVEVSSWWGRKIRVTKNTSNLGMTFPHASLHAEQPVPAPMPASQEPLGATETISAEAVPDTSRYVEIKAPIVGTLYRAPSPDSPPYINIGDTISVGQVICIIEAMKIMNEIESDVNGTVVDVLVENANPVEFNQPLVLIDPS